MIELVNIINTVQQIGNMGGVKQEVYAAPYDDFAEFATIPPEDGDRNMDTMNLLSVGQDRLKPGKKLISIYNTLEKASLNAERQGEIDGVSHKHILKLFTPGLKSSSLAMLLMPNMNWIFYVKTGEQMFRVGGPGFAAKLAPEGSVGSGDTTASLKGNEMVFTSYGVGYANEVVNPAAIDAMLNPVDQGLTVVYAPDHGDVNVLLSDTPTITFGEAVINADTSQAFSNQEIQNAIKLYSLDVDGNKVADKPFTAAIAGNVVTVTPTSDFVAATIYHLEFDASKVLSADTQGRVNGSNYIRFTTA